MTADRDALAASYANAYCCPHCNADTRLREEGPDLYVLEVWHDRQCPTLRADGRAS